MQLVLVTNYRQTYFFDLIPANLPARANCALLLANFQKKQYFAGKSNVPMYTKFNHAPEQREVQTSSRKGFLYNYPVVSGFILIFLAFLVAMMYVLKYAI
jgi:hypothetical protein